MLEAFNRVLVDARSKPIVTMHEEIRLYMMNRWASNILKVSSFQGSIYPKIRDRLEKDMQLTKYWVPGTDYSLFYCEFCDWTAS